jgi:hypothetical protein
VEHFLKAVIVNQIERSDRQSQQAHLITQSHVCSPSLLIT